MLQRAWSRVRHALFALLSVFSLLLGVLLAIAWQRSIPYLEEYRLHLVDDWSLRIITRAARIEWCLHRVVEPDERYVRPRRLSIGHDRWERKPDNDGPLISPLFSVGRFAIWELNYDDEEGIADAWLVGTPLWFCMAVTLVLPACRLRAEMIRWRRRRRGLCVRCGYDVRASLLRCSECGTSIRANKVAAAFNQTASRLP